MAPGARRHGDGDDSYGGRCRGTAHDQGERQTHGALLGDPEEPRHEIWEAVAVIPPAARLRTAVRYARRE
jgi:hypothetical protein